MKLRDIFQPRDFFDLRRLLCFGLSAAALSITGPFGTYYLTFFTRTSYWTVWLAAIWVPTTILFLVMQRGLLREMVPNWLISVLVFFVATPIAAFGAVALASVFFPQFPLSLNNIAKETMVLWPITLGLILLLHFTTDFNVDITHKESVGERVFFERLPLSLGQNILAISSADHYVQVKTERGEALVLLSLKRVEKELEHYPGLRIHRGHWVALDAIAQKVWRDARLFLELKDGTQLPVGRSYRSKVLSRI